MSKNNNVRVVGFLLVLFTFFCLGLIVGSAQAKFQFDPDPEKDAKKRSEFLKPISDEQWEKIAGEKLKQDYQITKGDTLSDLSKRLFGDQFYWPKLWAINSGIIGNAHVIAPGQNLVFMPGTGTSLPQVALQDGQSPGAPESASASDSPPRQAVLGRSQEWRKLGQQNWEFTTDQVTSDIKIDPLGFDSTNQILFGKTKLEEVRYVAYPSALTPAGRLAGSNDLGLKVMLYHSVFITPESESSIRVGETYSLVSEPYPLAIEGQITDKKVGVGYTIAGEVQVVDVHEKSWVGIVTKLSGMVPRDCILIERQIMYPPPEPVAAKEVKMGLFVSPQDHSTRYSAQYQYGFVNLGSADGITPGMIFRIYQSTDPTTAEPVPDPLMAPAADFMVMNTTENYSTVRGDPSLFPIESGSTAVLMTDLTQLFRNRRQWKGPIPQPPLGAEGSPSESKEEVTPEPTPSPEPEPDPTADQTAEPSETQPPEDAPAEAAPEPTPPPAETAPLDSAAEAPPAEAPPAEPPPADEESVDSLD